MKKMTKTLAISSAIATGIMMASVHVPAHAGKKAEKCYGVAKKGKNDCAIKSLGTSCAGSATKDGIADAWIYVPKGTCAKIIGGSTKAPKAKK